jgi:hypothetical protein
MYHRTETKRMKSADRNSQAKVSLREVTTELEAPVVLTPDQLEKVAAGFTPGKGPTTIFGGMPANPDQVGRLPS